MADLSERVSRVLELDATFPATKHVGRVEVRRIRMLAGTPSGAHVHNGPVFGAILAGRVRYVIAGGEERILQPGDVFYEPEGSKIERFDALDHDVEFIGVFPLEPGQDAAMVFV
ncbi:cupin domain-containing protein [Planctomonas sp. JC2975]|uniref:cupin domain-containing protein n=1 Tax=Planctomonas sp. JC2975 TaxID=2729626 RepID=UPI001473732E|nr:cupin domain-containing protein [Planctomonas sp. JC2975]NNC11347.1 cupin domain-containing protein [Planctomonas sp. JC2975]